MSRPSFISNSNSKGLQLIKAFAAILVAVFLTDRAVFFIFFPLYDKWLHIRSGLEGSDILLVGTSHFMSDVDVMLLRNLTGKTVGAFNIPGAGIVPRYYEIMQRLSLRGVPKPKLIILETSRLLLHPTRYKDDVAEYFMPYFYSGLFKDLVEIPLQSHPDHVWLNLFHTYSLNGSFAFYTDTKNVMRAITESILTSDQYVRFRMWTQRGEPSCLGDPRDAPDSRVAGWRETDRVRGFDNRIDETHLEYLKKTVGLAKREGVDLLFLEPPFFLFDDQVQDDRFGNIRKVFERLEGPHLHYLKISVPNRSCLFTDESHLTHEGEKVFTSALARWINSESHSD